ncbi:uncharacterized protein LOC131215945 [Anopheles bellator]|uniref:uncharacterized protein LOC131215945 n=1 Tax=Anopheles bellator TaxID=139047 RepID=UPI002649233E|nr:uncharacterized protein LOC131215945 [Anopheles bellator]
MPIIASSTFNKRLVEKVQKYRSEYAESHWKVWSQIAAEMSQEDGKTYAQVHLSKHFRNKLIPHLDSYALDEELVNQLQYPYLRRSSRNHVEENQRNSEQSSMDTTGETVVEKIPYCVDVTPAPLIVCTDLSLSFFTDPHESDAAVLSEEDNDANDATDEQMVSSRDDRVNKTNLSREVEDQSEPSTKRIRLDNSIKQEVVTNTIGPQDDVIVLDTSSDEEIDAENSATPHARNSLSAVITDRIHGSVNENQHNAEHSSMDTTGECDNW